jgi:hypothetical protein
MNQFEMVVIIVLIVVIGRVVSARYGLTGGKNRLRGTAAMRQADDGSAESARLRAEVTRLNDRIQVLERIATDPAKRLSDEIEQLKNK